MGEETEEESPPTHTYQPLLRVDCYAYK